LLVTAGGVNTKLHRNQNGRLSFEQIRSRSARRT
jgi:hypothetical protein